MHRMDLDKKEEVLMSAKRSLPTISKEYIENVLSNYRTEKAEDAKSRCVPLRKPMSQKMARLEQFCSTLPRGILNDEHFFEFIKIVFSKNLKEGQKTTSVINQILVTKFDARVYSALDSVVQRFGKIDDLEICFEAMCQYPELSAVIAHVVLILTDFIRDITKSGHSRDIYCQEILHNINLNPVIADDFDHLIKMMRESALREGKAIFNLTKPNPLHKLLIEDIRVFVFFKVYQQKLLTFEMMKRIEALKFEDLEELGSKIQHNPKFNVDEFLTSKEPRFSQFLGITHFLPKDIKPQEVKTSEVSKPLAVSPA